MSRLITILGVITAVAFAIAPELTSINPKASRYVMLVGVAAAAAGGSLLKRRALTEGRRFLLIAGATLILMTGQLSGCTKDEFKSAKDYSSRAMVAVAGAPLLIDSFVAAKVINEELGRKILDSFDSFNSYLVQANNWLQGATSLDAITKMNVLAVLRAALEQIDKVIASGFTFIKSEKVQKRIARILNLVRSLIAGVVAYLNAAKIAAVFMKPFRGQQVAELEELMGPEALKASD